MTTPYDAALRVIQREVDGLRLVIGETAHRLVELEQLRNALGASLQRETRVVDTSDEAMIVPTDRYFVQLRTRQCEAARALHDGAARLSALRQQAGEHYARLKTVETAAAAYRDAHAAAVAATEQSRADDMAAARFLRLRAAKCRALGLPR